MEKLITLFITKYYFYNSLDKKEIIQKIKEEDQFMKLILLRKKKYNLNKECTEFLLKNIDYKNIDITNSISTDLLANNIDLKLNNKQIDIILKNTPFIQTNSGNLLKNCLQNDKKEKLNLNLNQWSFVIENHYSEKVFLNNEELEELNKIKNLLIIKEKKNLVRDINKNIDFIKKPIIKNKI